MSRRPARSRPSASYGVAFGSPAHLASADARAAGSTTWTVTDLKVKVGDTVKKGQVLATADTADLKRQLADANTALDTAKIQLPAGQGRPVRRERRRRDRPDPPGEDRASTTPRPSSPHATKTRDDLETQIKLATLTSPIDGIVTTVNVVKGLEAPVRRRDRHRRRRPSRSPPTSSRATSPSMAVGQTAAVTIARGRRAGHRHGHGHRPDRGRQHDGQRRVVRRSRSRYQTCRPTVRAGMTADVTITIDSATNVLTVPAAALRGSDRQLLRPASWAPTARRPPSRSRSAWSPTRPPRSRAA